MTARTEKRPRRAKSAFTIRGRDGHNRRARLTDKENTMRALIVVESAFGNTASIAEAIASALTEKGAEANVAPADRAPSDPRGYGLVLVGAPTHNRGLPTPSTRRTARKKGAAVPDAGVLEWIAGSWAGGACRPNAERASSSPPARRRSSPARWNAQPNGPRR